MRTYKARRCGLDRLSCVCVWSEEFFWTDLVLCVCVWSEAFFSVLPGTETFLIAYSLSFGASDNLLIVENRLANTHIHPSLGYSDSEVMSFLGAAFYINLF